MNSESSFVLLSMKTHTKPLKLVPCYRPKVLYYKSHELERDGYPSNCLKKNGEESKIITGISILAQW